MTQPRVLKWLFLTFLALALVEGMLTLSLASTTRQMNQEFNGLKTDTAGMMSRLKNLPMLGLGPGGVPGAVSGTGPGAGPGAGPGTGPGVALARLRAC